MRQVHFTKIAFEQFTEWQKADAKIFEKIVALIKETQRNPFQGTGKPEPLKHELKNCWSRRITLEHRLVYQVSEDAITVIACKYHY